MTRSAVVSIVSRELAGLELKPLRTEIHRRLGDGPASKVLEQLEEACKEHERIAREVGGHETTPAWALVMISNRGSTRRLLAALRQAESQLELKGAESSCRPRKKSAKASARGAGVGRRS